MNNNDEFIKTLIETADQLSGGYVAESPKIVRTLGRLAANGALIAGTGLAVKDSLKKGNTKNALKLAALGGVGIGTVNRSFDKLNKRYKQADTAITDTAYKTIEDKSDEIIKHLREVIKQSEQIIENPNATKAQWRQAARRYNAAISELKRLKKIQDRKKMSSKR